MQPRTCFLIACLVSLVVSASVRETVTPVQKVVQMLMGMLEKGKKAKHEEQVQFATYKQFCEDTERTVKRQVKESEEKITMLKADIQKYKTEAADLSKDIQELEADAATASGDQKASSKVRELERTQYEAAHKDYTESVEAIGKAVSVLKKQSYDRKQAKMLLQGVMSLEKVPEDSKRKVDAFLAQDSDQAPEADGYKFQSNSVIDMLEKLKDKFVDERSALEKAELSSRHAAGMLQQSLKDQISNAEAAITTKSQTRSTDMQLVATRQGDLGDATSTKADDSKYVADLTGTCSTKSSDFVARQKLRADEITAVEKAIEILSSDDVKTAAEKHLPSMLQLQKGSVALAQLRSSRSQDVSNKIRMAAYLNDEATRIGSRMLAMIAIRSKEDPFAKVKKMLKDLITRLEEQAGEEAEHKGWCDTELGENKKVRTTRTASVEKLRSEIDELDASINKEAAEVTQLSQQVADLDKNVAKETGIRQKEKATNEETIKDSKDAQAAVARALVVLKEFYATASEATAFVQKQNPDAPDTFDASYKGMGGESGGVVGMLEVIQSDFARLESDTTAAEVTQAQAHNKFMTESAVSKAQKKTDITHKSNQKQNQEQQLADKKNDLTSEEKELDAANKYFDKLKPSCLDAGMSFEERAQRRKEEVESLQEALRILNGEDIAFLQAEE